MFNLFFRRYVPGFRVSPQDIPGFNVGSQDDVPGFNVNENGTQGQDTIWSYGLPPGSVTSQDPDTAQTPTPPPGMDDSAPPALPPLPEWPYRIGTMLPSLLPAAFDPRTGARIEINAPPRVVLDPRTGARIEINAPPRVVSPGPWSPSNVPHAPADTLTPFLPAWQNIIPTPPHPATNGSVYAQRASLQGPLDTEETRQRFALPSMPAGRPLAESNFTLASDRAAGEQQAALQEYQQRQPSAPLSAMALDNHSRKSSMRMAGLEGEPERTSSQLMAAYSPPMVVESGTDASRPNGQVNAQVHKPQAAPTVDLSRRDAAGLPIGTILSSIRFPDRIGGNPINPVTPEPRPSQGEVTARGIALEDPNIRLVGDGDSAKDLSRSKRHQRGVDASIADHVARGFEIVDRGPRAVDVPGFLTPRLYDYIIRDPITGLCYGVEVKTTILSTIRLDRQQVEKDAVVVALGGTVRVLDNVKLYGVAYSVYCFGCEKLDVRSAVLLGMLREADVPVIAGNLPGEIRP